MYTTQSKMISRAIWVEKKHVWKINLQKNGVRKSFYSSVPGDKGRKICAQNATSWLSGACPFSVSERTTVDTVFERYLQDKALETTNIYTIRNRYNNHIKPIIGKVPVMLLTKQDLKRVIYTAYRKHNLSQKSLKNIRGDLSGFCNYLDCADIRNDLRTSNIKIPSNAKKGQKQALDVSSLNILFTESQVPYNGTICQDSLIYAYRFQVVTGLRPGELMGLEWGDIDNDYIHIRRAINAKGITTNGKNEFAARDFPQTRYTRMALGEGVTTHDVAWITLKDGGYILPIPTVTYRISKPLTNGMVYLRKNKACSKSAVPLQFALDYVYQDLKQKHAKYQHIWDKKQRYKWDRQPITNEQIALIHKLAPDYKIDTHKMTRGDASRAIQLLTYKPEEWTPQTTPSEVQDDAKKSP